MKTQQSAKFMLLLTLFLSLFLLKGYAQAELTVVYYDGTENSFSITEDGRMYFEDDVLMIDDGSGNSPESIEIESIRKILVQEKAATPIESVGGGEIRISPNPCKDELFISNANSENALVEVYALTGQLVLKQQLHDGQIAVGTLKSGVYLLKVDSKTHKFIKL